MVPCKKFSPENYSLVHFYMFVDYNHDGMKASSLAAAGAAVGWYLAYTYKDS